MISAIHHLRKFGCYDDVKFSDGDIKPFNQINILFGSNGSGKTTLSNLFFLLSSHCKDKQNLLSDYIENDTSVLIQIDEEKVTEKNIVHQNRDIYVFNSKFITDHVYNGITSNVDAFSSEIKLTNESIKFIDDRLAILKLRESKIKAWQSNLELVLDDIWNTFKDDFQKIVSDARLTGKKPSVLDSGIGEFLNEQVALDNLYIEYKKKSQENTTKEKLSSIKKEIEEIFNFQVNLVDLNEILTKSIKHSSQNKVREKIEIFQELVTSKKKESSIGDLTSWFKIGGRLLHLGHDGDKRCPLCDTNLANSFNEILEQYKDYFNDAMNKSFASLEDSLQRLNIFRDSHLSGNMTKLKSIQAELKSLSIDYSIPDLGSTEVLNSDLLALVNLINKKRNDIENVLQIDQDMVKRLSQYVETINNTVDQLSTLVANEVSNLNKRSKREITEEIKSKINNIVKLDFNATNRSIFSKKRDNSTAAAVCKRINDHLAKEISKLNIERVEEISKLDAESKFVNYYLDHLGVLHFTVNRNKNKAQDNITITYNKTGKQKLNLRASLSEGEKTALAFAYFISKIRAEKLENGGTGLNDCIVVIDDPISSLDDNRLFQTANTIDSFFFYQGDSLMKIPNQVFILSHNQTFTKYIYGALKSNDRLKGLINDYYLHPSNPRIRKIPSTLKNFTNTYLIKLREIVEFKEKGVPEYDLVKNYLPNYIRIVLETFLSFKLALVNDDSDRVPGLSTLIGRMVGELKKTDDYEMEIDGGNKLNRDAIIKRLTHLKKIADHESHGNIAKGQEVVFISEDELKNFAKFTIQVIQYIDSIHISRTKGHY